MFILQFNFRKTTCFIIIGCFITAITRAQPVISAEHIANASRTALQSRFTKSYVCHIKSAAIRSLGLQQRGNRLLCILDLPGLGQWPLSMVENKLISEDYRVVTAGDTGITIGERPTCKTYSGYLEGIASSRVQLTLDENMIYGMVSNGSEVYYIEPLQYLDKNAGNDLYVIYTGKDVLPGIPLSCAATETSARSNIMARNNAGTNCVNIRLAIASDAGMFSRYGSSAAVQAHNIGVMNNVNWNFINGQFADNIEFSITTQYISQSAATDPLTPAFSGTDVVTLINSFKDWSNAGGFGGNYDLGQFWTTRNLGANEGAPGTVGYAYMGVLCSPFKYHILEDFMGADPSGTSLNLMAVASHEIGHNFSLQHDVSGANIMHPSVTSMNQWSPASLSVMNAYIPSLNCLSPCSAAGVPVTDFITSSDAVCTGSSIQLTDHSQHGPTSWNWSFPGANISTSADRNPVIFYSTPGTKTITLTASNSSGAGNTITRTILVGTNIIPQCKNAGASSGNAGIRFFALGQIRKISGGAIDDGNKYMDFSCSDITGLLPSTNYQVDFETGNWATSTFNGISFFIDYNNDGDFNDAGELVMGSSGGATIGWGNFSFTTPSFPPVTGQLLRARFIAKDWVWADDPCHNPMDGQVEDYSVFFPAPHVLPLRLVDFTGRKTDNGNYLLWHTADEAAHNHFDIERSENGIGFEKIGTVTAQQQSGSVNAYNFTDQAAGFVQGKKYYYRLKVVSTAGSYTYSAIIVLDANNIHPLTVKVYPNPFQTSFSVSLHLNHKKAIHVQISDASGKQVSHTERSGQAGLNNIQCQVPESLAPGIYFIRITAGTDQHVEKIRKD